MTNETLREALIDIAESKNVTGTAEQFVRYLQRTAAEALAAPAPCPVADPTPTDTALLDFVIPVLSGDDDAESNRRTAALMGALLMQKSGREAIIAAMQALGTQP